MPICKSCENVIRVGEDIDGSCKKCMGQDNSDEVHPRKHTYIPSILMIVLTIIVGYVLGILWLFFILYITWFILTFQKEKEKEKEKLIESGEIMSDWEKAKLKLNKDDNEK